MKQGKQICETLKGIRREIAEANEIDYTPTECTHEGDCAGTCPACESETQWLEKQLRVRQALGKAVTIAGLSVALGAMSSCHKIFQPNGMIVNPNSPQPANQANNDNKTDSTTVTNNCDNPDTDMRLMGDVAMPVIDQPTDEPNNTTQPKTTTKKKTTKKSSTKKN